MIFSSFLKSDSSYIDLKLDGLESSFAVISAILNANKSSLLSHFPFPSPISGPSYPSSPSQRRSIPQSLKSSPSFRLLFFLSSNFSAEFQMPSPLLSINSSPSSQSPSLLLSTIKGSLSNFPFPSPSSGPS